jgi:hypothetical protein
MMCSYMFRCGTLVRADVSEELIASVTLTRFGVTSQKTAFLIVTAVKVSNLINI